MKKLEVCFVCFMKSAKIVALVVIIETVIQLNFMNMLFIFLTLKTTENSHLSPTSLMVPFCWFLSRVDIV